jgi:hypothetical protein
VFSGSAAIAAEAENRVAATTSDEASFVNFMDFSSTSEFFG